MLKKVSIKTINKNKTRKTLLNVFMLTFIMFVISMSTVYALSYTVSYNNNTGSGTMSDSTYTSNPGTLRTNTFTKSGYKFMGWNKNSSATSDWYRDTNSITGTDGSSITLYAQWCKVSNGTIKISNNEVKDTYGNYVFRNNKYITVKADNKTINYGATLTHSYTVTGTLLGESGVTGTASYTVKDGSNNTITTNPIPVGTYTIYVSGLSAGSGYVIQNTNTGTLTVNQTTCNAPTNVQVTTAGRVTWTSSSNCSSAQHQVSIDGTNWTNATSGYNYLSTIIAGTGTRTVRVRAVAPNNNYVTSSAATASATVYTITFASNDTNKGTVSPTSYNVISGATVEVSSNNLLVKGITSGSTTTTLATIVPTNKTGYHFDNWSKTSGSLTSTQTITATFVGNTYTATFYYQSNITSGSTTVTNTGSTYQCTVTSGSTCTVNIPDVVKNSVGTYNNAYAGLRTSYGASMTAQVTSDVTTVTLSADASYYSLYSSRVTIYKPSSTSACNSTNTIFYRNQWFTSNTTMGTTVLSTTTTGTSNNASYTSGVSEYSLYGFATAYGTNTRTYNDLNALKTSDATTVYAVLSKSITGTFYYNISATSEEMILSTATSSANRYLRCTSNSAAGISNSNFTIPTVVQNSVGTWNNEYIGVSPISNTMSPSTPTTANTEFYTIYRTDVTNYYWNGSNYVSRTLSRNEYYTSHQSFDFDYEINNFSWLNEDTYNIVMTLTITEQGEPLVNVPVTVLNDEYIIYTDNNGQVELDFDVYEQDTEEIYIGNGPSAYRWCYGPQGCSDASQQINLVTGNSGSIDTEQSDLGFYNTVLSTSTTGISNYTTETGPGSSVWDYLSAICTGEGCGSSYYPSVGEAAHTASTAFNTTYKMNVAYQKGNYVSSIGETTDECYVYSQGQSGGITSCTINLPSITPNAGYESVGWNTTSGATTGTQEGTEYTLTNNSITLYANAKPIQYTVTVDIIGGTINGNSNQLINHGSSGQFQLVQSESEMFNVDPVCTNNQTATLSSANILTVSNVTSDTTCTIAYYPVETDYDYTGTVQDYTVHKDGYYYIEMAGAQGGNAWTSAGGTGYCKGGLGAKTSGYIELSEGDNLYFYVGSKGTDGASAQSYRAGGYNGGGASGNGGTDDSGGGGGGATDVRLTPGTWNNTSSLISRLMVASGGGGGSCINNASNNTTSYREGADLYNIPLTVAGWAQTCSLSSVTQNSGNAFGYGASGIESVTNHGAGGGGGGYYGGGYCNGNNYYSGGQGGTSYISGYAGVDSVANSTTITHTGGTKHYSNKYFIGAEMIASQNYNDGWAKITYVGAKPARRDNKLDNVRYIKSCTNHNTINAGNHWVEIQATKDGVNIAKGKTVTGTSAENNSTTHAYANIVDGSLVATGSSGFGYPSTGANDNQCVTIDLGGTYDLDEVVVWNYFNDHRRYISHDFQVSSNNSTWTNLSSDEVWRETSNGARFNAYIDHINGYRGRSAMAWWFDGFANTGTTRNATTTTWKNLAAGVATSYGNVKSATTAAATWGNEFLTLDGVDDSVIIAQMNYSRPTIEAVVSPNKTHTDQSVIASNYEGGGYGINIQGGNKVYGQYYLGGWTNSGYDDNTPTAEIGKIANFATTYNQSTMTIYKNGELKQYADQTGTIGTPGASTVMAIGTNPYQSAGAAGYFGGNVYSARFYNGVLTTDQLYRNYLYDKQVFHMRGETDPHDVKVNVIKGTVDMGTKTINHNNTGIFTITPNLGYGNPTVSCTNTQAASIDGNTLTVGPVTADTTCTVTYTGCARLAAGTYTAGSTISYGGRNYTVVSDNGNNVSLAYNGTYGSGTYNNANTYLTTNFVTADTTLNEAKNNGCLIDQGSGAYATSNTGSAANKPAYEHWTASGSVYVPSIKYNYTGYGTTSYVYGFVVTDLSDEAPHPTVFNTSCTYTTRYAAGATASVANTNSTISYTNDTCTSSTTSEYYNYHGYSCFLPNEELKTPSSSVIPLSKTSYYMNGSVSDDTDLKTTKTLNIITCGSTSHGQTYQLKASSSTKYTYSNPYSGTSGSRNYSSDKDYCFAGRATSTTSGTANSNLVRTYNMTTSQCSRVTRVSISTSAAKSIYYRPLIKVKEA